MMTPSPDFDVVVSGYGLAGECVASLLARLGHRVCVFERWPTLYGLPRTVSLDGEGARIVAKAGDIEHALTASSDILRFDIVDGEHRLITAMTWGEEKFCGFHNRISFYQPNVEEAIDAGARGHGVEVNQGWEVVSISQDRDAVAVIARENERAVGQAGQPLRERTVTARYVVGADGARSVTRQTTGAEWTYFDYRDAWLSVDVLRKRELPRLDPQVATEIIAHDRVIAAIPLGTERIRFEFLLGGEPEEHQDLSEAAGYEFLEEAWGLSRDDVEIYRQVVYPFEGRLAAPWRSGRVFLAGDAAHLMPPFVGMGAVSAFRDAVNLAWKLDLVLRGVCSEALLDTYELERSPHTRALIEIGVELGHISTISDPEAAAARDAAMRAGGAEPLPDPEYDVGIFDADSAGGPVRPAGLREPQGVVQHGGRTGLFDDVVGWGFTLALRGADPRAGLSTEQQEFLGQIGCNVVQLGPESADGVTVERDDAYESLFAEHGIVGFVSRPDFRIFAGIRDAQEIPGLIAELERRLHVVRAEQRERQPSMDRT
jgi:3-(3-hydroxy-phenyl)propionate hydroxylase